MPVKPAAVEADVSTELALGTSPFEGFDPGGAWTRASLTVDTREQLTIGAAPAAWKATASFTYTGTTGGSASSTSSPSEVTLLAASDPLHASGSGVLRDGDEATDRFGNKIRVSAARPLRSS